MRRRILFLLVALIALIAAAIPIYHATVSTSDAGTSDRNNDQEAIVHRGVTSCGVERWSVKTGTDAGARQVDTGHPFATNIYRLRTVLQAPGHLPAYSRLKPVETTVYKFQATLVRYKQEADSDYHLVLSDSGGRTMIAEIPAPQCVGNNSPFIHQLRYVRKTFSSRYHPTGYFQHTNTTVTISGVGFFDFLHGQSGVAPNGIELHPVLSLQYGGTVSVPPPPAKKPQPKPGPSGNFTLSAYVSPNPVYYDGHPTLYAKTVPGATCTASVVYSTGRPPRSFDGFQQTAGGNGLIGWSWHMQSKGDSGSATVTCNFRGQSKTTQTSFSIG